MAEEIKDETIDLWFRERCRCDVCGATATLGDLEQCEDCTSPIWRHDCPVDGETYIEHQLEHDRDRLQVRLQALQAALREEVAARYHLATDGPLRELLGWVEKELAAEEYAADHTTDLLARAVADGASEAFAKAAERIKTKLGEGTEMATRNHSQDLQVGEQWGREITISIYVEAGDAPVDNLAVVAAKGAERELHETYNPVIDYIGASTEPVQDKPEDQD